MTKINKISLLMFCSVFSAVANAESIMVSGTLETALPDVKFSTSPQVNTAFVKESTVTAIPVSDGCDISSDPNVKSTAGSLKCVFEWLPNNSGMPVANGFSLKGYPAIAGDIKLPWQIAYYSGSEREKVIVREGEYIFKTVEPVAPVFSSIKGSMSNGSSGSTLISYIKNETLSNIEISVEPRDYDMVASVGSGTSCAIAAGASKCSITTGSVGISDGSSDFGSRDVAITLNSANNFFSPPIAANVRLSWDYRAPAVDSTFWNISKEARAFKVGDKDIFVGPKTIAVAVSVPAKSDTGDWWKPAAMSLTLAPDGSFSPTTKVTLDDGTELNFNKIWSTPSRRTLQPVAGYQEVAGKYVYFFDISDLASASYIATFSVANTAGNDSSYTEPDSKLVLSDEPTVTVYKEGAELVKRDQVYFLNEIVIAAFQGEEGVADIKSVAIDNVMASYSPTNVKGIYRLNQMTSLETNKVHTLTIVAENVNGISKTYSIDFTYMPMTFTLKSIDSASTIYSYVRPYTSLVTQQSGNTCKIFSTEEDAQALLGQFGNGIYATACYVQWNNVPAGMEFYSKSKVPGLTGYFSKVGDNILDYNVYVINTKGSKALAAHNRKTIPAVEPFAPEISYKLSKTVSTLGKNTALVYISGGDAAKVLAKSVPANIVLTSKVEGQDPETTTYKNKSSGDTPVTYSERIKVPAAPLWTQTNVNIDVAYENEPSIKSSSILKVYTVPNFSIRAYMKVEERKSATSLKVPVSVNIGQWNNSCSCTLYDEKTMGNWDVVVYKVTSKWVTDAETGKDYSVSERTPLTGQLAVNSEGIAAGELNMDDLTLGSHRIIAVATVRSPFDDFELQRETSTTSIRVYKGADLEGGLSKSLIVGRVPLSAMVSFRTKSTDDYDSLSPTEWQISSNNGSTWTTLEDMTGLRSVSIKQKEVGKWLYRAKLTNKYTGKTSYTDNLTVVAYREPKPVITVGKVLEGHSIPVTLTDNNEEIKGSAVDVQWSEDGEDWTEGGVKYTITSSVVPKYIFAKVRYTETDEMAGTSAWKETLARVTVIKHKKLSVKVEGNAQVEVGKKVTLQGTYTNPNIEYSSDAEVLEEWILPDGSVKKGGLLDTVLTEDMLDARGYAAFTYQAYMPEAKERTLAKRTISVKSWVYKFPEPRLNTKLKYTMIPSELAVSVTGVDVTYPGVVFSEDWQYNKDVMTLESDTNGKKVFQVFKSGTHTLTYVLKDNRNNEARVEYTFVVNEQNPMEITVNPKYSNKFMRAPLDLSMRSSVKLAHSADSIDSVSFKLNGKAVDGGKNYWSQTFENIMEGSYKLEMDVVSTQGQRGSVTVDFDVIPNTPPNCSLTYTETPLSWAFTAKCNDPDGKISSYVWKVNDQVRGVFGSTATLSKSQNKGKLVVSITAYDDSGDTATSFITLNN